MVDVREPRETAARVIAGALHYPVNCRALAAGHGSPPTDRPSCVICRSDEHSRGAFDLLTANGHLDLHNVLGGMNAWVGAGSPVPSR